MRVALIALAGVLSATSTSAARAQQWARPATERWEELRMRLVRGDSVAAVREPLVFHAPSTRDAAPGISFLPLAADLVVNTHRPWGWNDGALWAGDGWSGALLGGGRFRTGPLTVTVAPTVWFAQNIDFDVAAVPFADRDPLAFPWSNRIDLPQRPGDGAVARLDPGQSGARLDWRALTLGFSWENMWWGPAARHPILHGSSAAGFPHLDLGLRPARTPAGPVELRVVWGRLDESAWFDSVPDNDDRLFAGVTLGWSPRWLPGLTVGFERVFYQAWTDTLGAADFFAIVQPFTKDAIATPTDPEGDDARDQMLALTWHWRLPAAGFEVYGEWARNDHNRNWHDFILEPDHSQAWMLGLQKTLPSGDGTAAVRAEWAHLGKSSTAQVRANPTFYFHHIVRQGYTHDGQLLGAGIGPGSDAQWIAFDRWHDAGRWGLWAERVRWYDDSYYALFADTRTREGHNVTLELGGRYSRDLARARLGAQLSAIRELNRHFVVGNHTWNVNGRVWVEWNWGER